jgi:predicted branched-subunit amino acid permease
MEKMAKQSSVTSVSIGVGLATGLYGISFGALSVAAGLDIWQTQVLSLLMFSGGSQFAFVGVVAAAGGVASGGAVIGAAIVSAWLLGIRNGFYAVRMAPILQRVGLG